MVNGRDAFWGGLEICFDFVFIWQSAKSRDLPCDIPRDLIHYARDKPIESWKFALKRDILIY